MQAENKEILREFGARLRSLMENRGVRPKDVVEALGVRSGNVSGWRGGEYFPRTELRPKLAALLGVSETFLIHGNAERISDRLETYPELGKREMQVNEASPSPREAGPDTRQTPATLQDCERYFLEYLQRAQQDPNAGPFIWRQLQKHFPLDEFEG